MPYTWPLHTSLEEAPNRSRHSRWCFSYIRTSQVLLFMLWQITMDLILFNSRKVVLNLFFVCVLIAWFMMINISLYMTWILIINSQETYLFNEPRSSLWCTRKLTRRILYLQPLKYRKIYIWIILPWLSIPMPNVDLNSMFTYSPQVFIRWIMCVYRSVHIDTINIATTLLTPGYLSDSFVLHKRKRPLLLASIC